MNEGELAVAELLTELGVRWEYEPTMFILHATKQGVVKEGFRPDFFLPDLEVYIEVTQAKQSNTTRKHRKVRELAEIHGVYAYLIEKADFRDLKSKVLEILNQTKWTPESPWKKMGEDLRGQLQ